MMTRDGMTFMKPERKNVIAVFFVFDGTACHGVSRRVKAFIDPPKSVSRRVMGDSGISSIF